MSLDGYIAGPVGEFDWIVADPDVDFAALFARFDVALMGRKTFEVARAGPGGGSMPGIRTVVVSTTLDPRDHPGVTILSDRPERAVARLRDEPGKDIWLFGGGTPFRSLLGADLVDAVEVAVVPILLGAGLPLLPPPASRAKLRLAGHKAYRSGIVSLAYVVEV